MMEKFRILKLTEYSRVMYLDYDVMPTCNLDYMFELSDPIIESVDTKSFRLKETVILAYQSEPSSGGMFLVKPNSTDYDDIQRIIHEKETRSWSKSFVSLKENDAVFEVICVCFELNGIHSNLQCFIPS